MNTMRIVLLGFFMFVSTGLPAGQIPAGYAEDPARISRIENGLLPGITVKGRTTHKMNLADRMKHYHVPGVSIAFFDHGRIMWTRTYGFADVSQKRPITPATLFEAGSISKPTTALAVLRLVQDGELRLDEDVNAKLSGWKVPENEFTHDQKVTLRRLLSHSAGLNVHGFDGYAQGEPLPTGIQILNGEKPANTPAVRVITVPGTVWRYSGGGYMIAQMLLTDVLHTPFPKVLDDLVLHPAGMTNSTFEQPLPPRYWAFAATPYRADGNPVEGGFHNYPEMGAAGLWTTPSDLARLMIEVQAEYTGKSSKILSPDMARELLTRQKDDWALGFAIEKPGHKLRFGHGGSDEGFESQVETYTESAQGIAIMTNGARGDELIREILCAVAQEYNWPDFRPREHNLANIDPALLSGYEGVYEIPGAGKVIVVNKNGRLYIHGDQASPVGSEPQKFLPESDTRFFILSDTTEFQFQTNENGATQLIIKVGGDVFEAAKTSQQER